MGRGANWTSADDVQLCKSWLHVSSDPVVGTNQKSTTFWEKIADHIKEQSAEETRTNPSRAKESRTLRSQQSRFSFISAAVSKFSGVYSQQQRNAASGTNDQDLERAALEIYRSQPPTFKSFDHRECWLVLKQDEKWAPAGREPLFEPAHHAANVEEPGTPTEPGTPAYNGFRVPERPRPTGVKKAKSELLAAKVTLRQLNLAEKANVMAYKRQRIMQQQVALGYFKLDVSQVPVEMREIFVTTRNGLINELNQSMQEPQPGADASNDDLDANSPLDEFSPEDSNLHGQGGDGYPEDPSDQQYASYTNDLNGQDDRQENAFVGLNQAGPSSVNAQPAYQTIDEFSLRIGI